MQFTLDMWEQKEGYVGTPIDGHIMFKTGWSNDYLSRSFAVVLKEYLFGSWNNNIPNSSDFDNQEEISRFEGDVCIYHKNHPKFGQNIVECRCDSNPYLFSFFKYKYVHGMIDYLTNNGEFEYVPTFYAHPEDRSDFTRQALLKKDKSLKKKKIKTFKLGMWHQEKDHVIWQIIEEQLCWGSKSFSNWFAAFLKEYLFGSWNGTVPDPEYFGDQAEILWAGEGQVSIFHKNHQKFGPNIVEFRSYYGLTDFVFFKYKYIKMVIDYLTDRGEYTYVPTFYAHPEDRSDYDDLDF